MNVSGSQYIISTERLRLRQTVEDDLPALHAMFNDPLVMRFYPGLKNMRQTREWFDWLRAEYAQCGHCLWTVELIGSREFIGQIGLIRQDVQDVVEVEVGYLLRSEHWHRGYATEAARACRDYGFNILGRTRLISLIRPENTPSIRVAERNGMVPTITILKRGLEHLVFAVERPAAPSVPNVAVAL